eukprot:2170709-Pleurochrysis_carterae.AAC.1
MSGGVGVALTAAACPHAAGASAGAAGRRGCADAEERAAGCVHSTNSGYRQERAEAEGADWRHPRRRA